MKNLEVVIEIKSKDSPYYYKGTAQISKDLVFYKDKEEEITYDKRVKVLIKKSKKQYLRLDFLKKSAFICYDDMNLEFDIEVLEIKEEENKEKIKYKLDKDLIELTVKVIG